MNLHGEVSRAPPGRHAERRSSSWLDRSVAAFAAVAIALHDGVHIASGRYWDVFWVCNVAALLVAPALVFRSPMLSAAAITWLFPGTIVWLADAILAGSNLLPTSYAVHIGGTLAALYATRRNGFAPRGWLAALAVLAAAVVVSRVFLPASANVNAAHTIPKGWGFLGASRGTFVMAVTALVATTCALGRIVGRLVAAPSRTPTR